MICFGVFLLAVLAWGIALLLKPNLLRRVPPYERWVAIRFFRWNGETPTRLTDDQIRFYAIPLIAIGVFGLFAIILRLLAESQGGI